MTSKTPELTGAGEWRLEYLSPTGWWVGHRGIDIPDIKAYVARVNANGAHTVRAISKVTGEIIGDATPCSMCGEPHSGVEGSCLL